MTDALPFSTRSRRVDLSRLKDALQPAHLEALTARRRKRLRCKPEALRRLADEHARGLEQWGGTFGDLDTANLCGHVELDLRAAALDRVVASVRHEDEASLFPRGTAGFDAEALLGEISRLAAEPSCALDEAHRAGLLWLARSYLQSCAWIVTTEHRIGSSYIYWYGHCQSCFVQSLDGSCLHLGRILGESC
ncbi:MAG: hypothetical protein JXR96_05670 [Deltaproteobacteria bacterium]|nr:hypothetical protein [Deltaproteobacteria bacterium]